MEIIKRSRLMIAWEFVFGKNGSSEKHAIYVEAVETLDRADVKVDSMVQEEESPK